MKAVVFHKPGEMKVDKVEETQIENPQDIILRVTATAICGSDLHIYDGLIPQTKPLIMGHLVLDDFRLTSTTQSTRADS